MISVAVLGGLDIRDATRGPLTTLLAQPKRAALLAYLAAQDRDGLVSRDALVALFWPQYDEQRARGALRQALAFLRRSLGEHAIRSLGDDAVGVDRTVVSCDLTVFRTCLLDGRDDDAVALYRGPFLDALVVDDAPGFEQWVAHMRTGLARDTAAAEARLADRLLSEQRYAGAVEHARRAQVLEPFNESHHRRLLTAMDLSGDRSGALMAHEAFVASLGSELAVDPSPETRELVEAIRSRSSLIAATPRVATRPEADVPATQPATPVTRAKPRRAWPGVLIASALVAAVVLLVRGPRALDKPASTAGQERVASRIVVLPLTHHDADSTRSSLGMMASDWITEGLSRLEGIEVVPATAVLTSQEALASVGESERWQRVALDVGAGMIVRGDVYREGQMLHLQAQVIEAKTGRLLRPVERVSVMDDSVMRGIDQLRTRVVAAIAPLADTVTHLRRAIAPPTYEAYRDYVAGLVTFVRGDPRAALDLFERSAVADAAWPMPRIAATIMRLNLNDADGAQRLIASLEAQRARLGPLEASTLDMAEGLLHGDLPRAYDASVRQAKIAPGTIGEYMIGELARKMNRPAEAVSVLRALGPDRGELRGWQPYWRELTFALHLLGQHDEELVAAREAARRYPSDVTIALYELRALAALGDRARLTSAFNRLDASSASVAARASARVTVASEILAHDAERGDDDARAVVAWFDSLPGETRNEPALRRQAARALLLAGRAADARLRLVPLTRDTVSLTLAVMGLVGNAAAADGDTAEARRWMSKLEARARGMTPAARGLSWGEPTYWQATIAARLTDSTRALALLREARREGLGMEPAVHAEPAFAALRRWPPFAAVLSP
ncbi:MAG: hypothetical protein H7066_21055 [Cytophagaceae bacterium]|nr:hypothetical protein [Gemmatimonadaceae bacterium]